MVFKRVSCGLVDALFPTKTLITIGVGVTQALCGLNFIHSSPISVMLWFVAIVVLHLVNVWPVDYPEQSGHCS